jgi:hypothetical protein
MAVHAAVLWAKYERECGDWRQWPSHGPVVALYGVDDYQALTEWTERLVDLDLFDRKLAHPTLVFYSEPDLEPTTQALAAVAWYGSLPIDHGLRLL